MKPILFIALLVFCGILYCLLMPCATIGLSSDQRWATAKNSVVILATAEKSYYQEYGTPLKGDKPSILRILQGDNPKKLVFLEIDPKYFSKDGVYLDPWGTPYVFDLSNPLKPWAYSWGKNRIDEGGNGDDLASWQ